MQAGTRSWLVLMGLVAAAAAAPAVADECSLSVNANDMMQFSPQQLSAPASCQQVQVTLHHVGKQPVAVMGHNWVLTRTKDAAAIAALGTSAGLQHDYLPPAKDARIIAATKLVGGGQSATVKFSTDGLVPGESYQFFCSAPGHITTMKGRFSLKK